MVNKKRALLTFVSFILLVFLVNFVSAGLCKGSDGYYHDCDDFSDSYYNRNFKSNYKTEYYKETSSSSSSVISITEDRHSYEELAASSYAESSVEYLKKERDYSYPKYYYDKYGRKRYNDGHYNYDKYDKYGGSYYDKDDYYESYDDKDDFVVFVNKVEPIHYRRRAQTEKERANWQYDYEDDSDESNWRHYWYADDDYYKPRYSYEKDNYNWRW